MRKSLIIALLITLTVSVVYMVSNPNQTAYKANQGYMTKI